MWINYEINEVNILVYNSPRFLLGIYIFLFTDRDMGARHRARASTIQIIKVEEVPSSKCRRTNIKQFHVCFNIDQVYFIVLVEICFLMLERMPLWS